MEKDQSRDGDNAKLSVDSHPTLTFAGVNGIEGQVRKHPNEFGIFQHPKQPFRDFL